MKLEEEELQRKEKNVLLMHTKSQAKFVFHANFWIQQKMMTYI